MPSISKSFNVIFGMIPPCTVSSLVKNYPVPQFVPPKHRITMASFCFASSLPCFSRIPAISCHQESIRSLENQLTMTGRLRASPQA